MKRIVVLGAAESGAGAAVLAKKQGFDVFVSDMSAIKDKYKEMLDSHGIEWEEGHHTEEKILNADEIIKSPGIPSDAPIMIRVAEKGIHVISEIEFAGRYVSLEVMAKPLLHLSFTISSSRLDMMPDWLEILGVALLCRWLKTHTNTTSSN